ncbi:RNA polymerase sigma factor [Litchfieldia salsa]|uniref:RNA polymerase sigma-70 factor, ECF subfamily n=1 Tax=Litchfieldia salsa TaxID=930152 RepID=A0A1H0U1L1_9BACI|nr:RNA polymerase sigma factor [Litchfieldia salsa]SDP59848.1 RNA polymerase sigma-70 factor, ECF subfamily [Litchfieldia salsa]
MKEEMKMDHELMKRRINEWYFEYSNDLYQYVVFMIRDHDQAKDIMQDTFLKAYTNYERYQGGNAKAWLFRIARNLTIDYIRKKKPISLLFEAIPFIKNEDPTPEQMTTLNETERELYRALGKIKRSYREVIILRKMKDFSVKESAELLGWSESKVKTTLLRAIAALKKQLEEEGFTHETIL